MPTVKVRDISLYYELYGKGDPIIFSHGMLDDSSVWRAQTDILAQKHTVILYDHRGHGKSDKPRGDYSVQTLSDDLNGLILGLNLDKVTLVGHSLGGMTVLTLTLDHPDRVSKLVLVSTTASTLVQLPLVGTIIAGLGSLVPYGMFARRMQGLKVYRPSEEVINPGLERAAQVPEYVAYACIRGLVTNYDVRRRVSQIQAPTLIVAGERDRGISVRMSRFLHREIKESRLEVIPKCGHVLMIEKPVEFNNILTGFLG